MTQLLIMIIYYIGVELRPDGTEMFAKLTTHEFVVSFCGGFEGFENDCDEEFDKDSGHYQRVGKKENL